MVQHLEVGSPVTEHTHSDLVSELATETTHLSSVTPAEVGGLVERLRGIPVKWIDLRMGEEAADAIEALTAALASERAAHAETKLERDEALKALVIANAQLDNMEFLSVEGFMDWQQEYRAASRALTGGREE